MHRRKRRAFAVALVCALLGALAVAPVARGQDLIEYALFVALLQTAGFNDTTPPAITITTPPEGATYAPGQAVPADYVCSDAGVDFITTLANNSGHSLDEFLETFSTIGHVDLGHPACDGPVASGANIDTATPGTHSFTVNARDIAVQFVDTNNDGVPDTPMSHPNTSTLTHHYFVRYPFGGFQRPVEDVNTVKAGQAVPIKFSLGGNRGLGILPSAPASQPTNCDGTTTGDPLPAVPSGNSTLQYDAASNTYTWVWKTDKAWTGSCRTLTVALDDGTQHTALFRFK
jgi:hypothetical protein